MIQQSGATRSAPIPKRLSILPFKGLELHSSTDILEKLIRAVLLPIVMAPLISSL